MKFLVDAQLPPSLARWISTRAHEATHVFDVAMHTAGDAAIWEYVATNGCVLLTKDEDFVDRSLLSPAPIALVWGKIRPRRSPRAFGVALACVRRRPPQRGERRIALELRQ